MTRDDRLDDLFAAARGQGMAPSDDLLARVMAEALAHQPAIPAARPVAAAPRRRAGFWATLAAAIGGAGAVAALGSAAAAGVAFGYADPSALEVLTAGYYNSALDTVDLVPSVDALLNSE